jgi:hypothetical protein
VTSPEASETELPGLKKDRENVMKRQTIGNWIIATS